MDHQWTAMVFLVWFCSVRGGEENQISFENFNKAMDSPLKGRVYNHKILDKNKTFLTLPKTTESQATPNFKKG